MPKISALPPAGTLADDDETPFVDDSVATTKKFTLAGLLTWLLGGGKVPILRSIQLITSSTTYSKPAGMTENGFVIVEVQGGGGAGGGAPATSGAQYGFGAGGGGGVYARKKIAAASLAAGETVTIGAAGAPASGATGGAGGNSSFGAHCTANGGSGGPALNQSNASGAWVLPAVPVTTGTGDLVKPGECGSAGLSAVTNSNGCCGGGGGNSRFGAGGIQRTANNAGLAADGYGAGGGAAAHLTSQSARSGGAGTAGLVLVYEYY